MPVLSALDGEITKQWTESTFGRPSDIVEEVLLMAGDKLATLERWQLSILSELNASNEGMAIRPR